MSKASSMRLTSSFRIYLLVARSIWLSMISTTMKMKMKMKQYFRSPSVVIDGWRMVQLSHDFWHFWKNSRTTLFTTIVRPSPNKLTLAVSKKLKRRWRMMQTWTYVMRNLNQSIHLQINWAIFAEISSPATISPLLISRNAWRTTVIIGCIRTKLGHWIFSHRRQFDKNWPGQRRELEVTAKYWYRLRCQQQIEKVESSSTIEVPRKLPKVLRQLLQEVSGEILLSVPLDRTPVMLLSQADVATKFHFKTDKVFGDSVWI